MEVFMRLLRDEFFIRKDFAFYDSCILSALPVEAVAVYDLLRRHAWPGCPPWGFETERQLFSQRMVFSVLTQGTQADMLGLTKASVGKHLGLLRKLGWISVVKRKRKRNVYVMGNTPEHHPVVWWADVWLNHLYTWMLRVARPGRTPFQDWEGTGDPGLDALDREERCEMYEGLAPVHDRSLADIPLDLRLKMARVFYKVALDTEDVREAAKLGVEDLETKG